MFRQIARRYDKKHIANALNQQERFAKKATAFNDDTSQAFVINDAEKVCSSSCDLKSWTMDECEEFFRPISEPNPVRTPDNHLVFQSDIKTTSDANDAFKCIVTESGTNKHAVVVFHHWYAKNRYPAFAKFFASKGITIAEATLPYHFERASKIATEEKFANADLGLTVQSFRQAVLDGRKIVSWLSKEGYEQISVLGMCAGGIIAGLIAAQDTRVTKAVMMVSPSNPADAIWTGETQTPLRARIESETSLDELKTVWSILNLEKHTWWLSRSELELMFMNGIDDTVVRPEGLSQLIKTLRDCERPPTIANLRCGHSSVSLFPFNIIAAWRVLTFLRQ